MSSAVAVLWVLCGQVVALDKAADVDAPKEKVRVVVVQNAAGGQAIVVQGGAYGGRGAPSVRETVDVTDPNERVALLTPAGPVVIDLELFIDGKPFRIRREALVEDLLTIADTNRDGTPHWSEAIKTARFTFGRIRPQNEQQVEATIKQYDLDGNGIVDRYEARRFVAVLFDGGDFHVAPSYSYAGAQGETRRLLDTDKNGDLSRDEIAAAAERLKAADSDDNDIVARDEVGGLFAGGSRQVFNRRAMQARPANHVLLLGPTVTAETLAAAFKQRYGEKESLGADNFRIDPALFRYLDQDEDGTIQDGELLRLNEAPAHLKLAVHIGGGQDGPRVSIAAGEGEKSEIARKAAAEAGRVLWDLPGLKCVVAANAAQAFNYNYEQTAKSLIMRYDADSNGYLEAKEMEGNLRYQFDNWDVNGDGKVYADEITDSYNRQVMPTRSQLRLTATEQGDPLFQALDANGDGRLGLREMQGAPKRLAELDKDGDGILVAGEVPSTLNVDFSLGTGQGGGGFRVVAVPGRVGNQPGRPATGGPDWFVRMDRNADGDLTPREFLGTPEQFKKLDANGDGFIERSEAEAAEKK
jgi:Ca2+-binding EF-hand superfamily protein